MKRQPPRSTLFPSTTLFRSAAGYDVPARLPALAAARPLPDRHPARELHWRLLDDCPAALSPPGAAGGQAPPPEDRKSTRLNSSHANISYAVFCLKKKTTSHT